MRHAEGMGTDMNWGSRTTTTLIAAMMAMSVAAAAPATADTTTEQRREYVSRDTNPCTGAVGTATNVANEVLHLSVDGQGREHFTFTSTGTLRFVPDDAAAETVTGRFTTRVNGYFLDGQPRVFSFGVSARVVDAAGTALRFHYHEHVTVDPDGSVRVELGNLSCHQR